MNPRKAALSDRHALPIGVEKVIVEMDAIDSATEATPRCCDPLRLNGKRSAR
jgi:hypothetical protein